MCKYPACAMRYTLKCRWFRPLQPWYKPFEKALYQHLESEHRDLLNEIRDQHVISDEEKFYKVIENFKQIHLFERVQ